ncbi:MAG: MaoC/PaaZ C-terminal domain-containing protein [Gammaproteobacteria bacterium]|nr:MaoC/PaaZ C-terminal domain-containing protein [Gammaproteobacteria bacterium]MDH3410754.1 MaoC/PaaZ C-terminal domain-containing protein [Gammaproteobacteria bacterium]
MALNYDELMARSDDDIRLSYADVETMLYAQSIGLGRDPSNAKELPYVYEQGQPLRTVPSMASVLVPDMFPPDLGWDFTQVLHAEQRLHLHRPLPAAAELAVNKRIVDIFDRGPKRGAMILFEAEGRLTKDDSALFSLGMTVIARGDGGFGGHAGSGPAPHRAPRRDPDLRCISKTRVDQALLFRLNGDRNPLHADPAIAVEAGFQAPILHGLCTYGIACHAILQTICDYDYTLIKEFDARFSSPVMPGDTIRTDMWQDGNIVSFRCTATERDTIVLRNGKCTLAT